MKAFWDKIAEIYDIAELTNKSVNEQMTAAVESDIPKGALVLDCAAGTGMLSMAAAKKARHVTCTDMSRKMLIRSMQKAKAGNVRNIGFAKRNIIALNDEDNKYDAVIAGNVLHLLDEPEKAVRELVRVTKPGGKIILPTYLLGESGFFKILIKLYKLLGFSPKKDFTLEQYLEFISKNAEANGCAEYSTRILFGNFPAGYAVIRK